MVQIDAMRVLAAFILLSGWHFLLQYAQHACCIDVRDGGDHLTTVRTSLLLHFTYVQAWHRL